MKNTILSFITVIAAMTSSFAQPVLDSAALCPVPKDVFIGHMPFSVTGILPGASGPGVTWNFATLADDSQDSTVYLSCAATPACSLFTADGSNLACYTNDAVYGSGYYYFVTDTNRQTLIGGYVFPVTAHATNGQDVQFFSLQYLKTHLDTSEVAVSGIYHYQIDSSIVDGYGDLTLPTGTFTNVMRVLTVDMSVDSSTGVAPDTVYTQIYSWFDSGFHNALLEITIDTANGNTVEYYTKGTFVDVSLQTANAVKAHTMQVFPNPATDEINIKFDLQDAANASVVITDVTGRIAGNIPAGKLKTGLNDILFPVSGLPGGMYIVRLTSGTETISQKIVVAK